MNELQKTELELFRCFTQICDKLNLTYFLVCGSALGAARHGGFIPWDDDLDVGMYRDDYNKFMELAPALLPKGIFLQNYKTDPEFPYMYAKLRNSNTTYIEKRLAPLNINHGVYIDIFPLDGYPSNRFQQKKFEFMKRNYKRHLTCALVLFEKQSLKTKILVTIRRVLGYHKRTAKTLEKYEALLLKYPVRDSEIVCNHGTWHGFRDYVRAEFYGKGIDMDFEGVKARVPEKWDDYLTALFEDWRNPPPLEKQVGHHYYEICDLEKPFTYYLRDKK